MFNAPQEAPAKKPLTTSKPDGSFGRVSCRSIDMVHGQSEYDRCDLNFVFAAAMESREEHSKQLKSDSKRLEPVKSSRDGCPLPKTIKNVSASVLIITSSPRLPASSLAITCNRRGQSLIQD
ncbi:unnamed protein product [Sphagnum compactum]